MIRALSISCLAIGFVLSAIHCLCGMSVQAEVCHVQPAVADCCCAENDGSVTDVPSELPPALPPAGPRFSGPAFPPLLPPVSSLKVPSPRLSLIGALHSASADSLPPLYLMKSAFLI